MGGIHLRGRETAVAITKEQVEHVAKLARLGLSAEEKEALTGQLSRILDHVAQLNRLNTSQVAPTFHVLPLQNIFRADEPHRSLPPEAALANAPEAEAGCFKVPKITEG